MATGQYPRRTSGTFIVKRHKLSSFSHFCHPDTPPKVIPWATVDSSHRGRLLKLWRNHNYIIKEWTGQSLSSIRWQRLTEKKQGHHHHDDDP